MEYEGCSRNIHSYIYELLYKECIGADGPAVDMRLTAVLHKVRVYQRTKEKTDSGSVCTTQPSSG